MAWESPDPIKIVRDYTQELKKHIKVDRVILFGSAVRGEMTFDSDLDIIVISSDFGNIPYMKRLQLLSKIRGRKFIFIPMDIFGYTAEEFEKMSKLDQSVVLSEAKREGKVVYPNKEKAGSKK